MSQENVEPVRLDVKPKKRSGRSLDLRLVARLPRLWRAVGPKLSGLAPTSRLRQLTVRHFVRVGFDAYNRHDYEALRPFMSEDMRVYPEVAGLVGLDDVYHGPDGFVQAHQAWRDAWGGWTARPEEVVDFGDRVLTIARVETSGSASGVPVAGWACNLYEIRDGLIVSERIFLDRSEALEAVGLRE